MLPRTRPVFDQFFAHGSLLCHTARSTDPCCAKIERTRLCFTARAPDPCCAEERTRLLLHGPCQLHAVLMNAHASLTRPVRLTYAALKDTHASLARSVPDPCSLFLAASAALLTHEPLFSTRDQMLLLNKSFTTLSAPDLPFKA